MELIHENDFDYTDEGTGEIKQISVPVCVASNVGKDMCIDEKMIGEDFFTILSNRETGKIAFMADTTKSSELEQACIPIKSELDNVEIINRDLAGNYRKFSDEMMHRAAQTSDKFHVVKLLLDAGQAVRMEQKRQIATKKREAFESFKEAQNRRKQICQEQGIKYKKQKFVYKEKVLSNGETPSQVLNRSRYLLYKFPEQWTENQERRSKALFSEFPVLEKAYKISLDFRNWYSKKNIGEHKLVLEKKLFEWYESVEKSGISDLMNFSSTVERNQESILNYFHYNGSSNAMAENRNAKIKKFINSNQGIRDRDFFFFRLHKYFT